MLKVIGIGNSLRGDDGIGPLIIHRLRNLNLSDPIKLIEVDSDPFSILEHLIGPEPVLIIDCAMMGKNPGDILKFNVKESRLNYIDKCISLHSIGFGEIYQIAQNISSVAECNIIGVEPKSIAYNTGLSEEIEKSVSEILDMVIKEAKFYAKKDSNN